MNMNSPEEKKRIFFVVAQHSGATCGMAPFGSWVACDTVRVGAAEALERGGQERRPRLSTIPRTASSLKVVDSCVFAGLLTGAGPTSCRKKSGSSFGAPAAEAPKNNTPSPEPTAGTGAKPTRRLANKRATLPLPPREGGCHIYTAEKFTVHSASRWYVVD